MLFTTVVLSALAATAAAKPMRRHKKCTIRRTTSTLPDTAIATATGTATGTATVTDSTSTPGGVFVTVTDSSATVPTDTASVTVTDSTQSGSSPSDSQSSSTGTATGTVTGTQTGTATDGTQTGTQTGTATDGSQTGTQTTQTGTATGTQTSQTGTATDGTQTGTQTTQTGTATGTQTSQTGTATDGTQTGTQTSQTGTATGTQTSQTGTATDGTQSSTTSTDAQTSTASTDAQTSTTSGVNSSTSSAINSATSTFATSTISSTTSSTSASASATSTVRPVVGTVAAGVSILHCSSDAHVALTFDDGPFTWTGEVMDQLEARGHKGTFFMNGLNWGSIFDYTSAVTRAAGTHQVGSHTWSHIDLGLASKADITTNLVELEDAFMTILGKYPTYLRPPYLSMSDVSLGVAKDLGYRVISIDLDTKDYENTGLPDENTGKIIGDPQIAIDNYKNGYKPGAISLAHDVHEPTVHKILPAILDFLETKQMKSVTVGECLGEDPQYWYATK